MSKKKFPMFQTVITPSKLALGIKVGWVLKSSGSQAQFVLGILRSETAYTLEYLSLFHERKSLMTRSALKKYSYERQGCFNSNYVKSEKVWFCLAFRHRVTNFKPHFLSPQKSKFKNFNAYQQSIKIWQTKYFKLRRDGMTQFNCSLSALWVLSDCSLSHHEVILQSSWSHPEVILKSSCSHPEVIL